MANIINFLRVAFPFLLTLALWRVGCAWWNPAGILALIPVFYCSFVRPVPWFAPMAILACFLVDYNFDVPFVWTSVWCLAYALHGFLPFIDIQRMNAHGIPAFAIFLGVGMLFLIFGAFHVMPVLGAVWTYVWCMLLYMPVAQLIKRVGDD